VPFAFVVLQVCPKSSEEYETWERSALSAAQPVTGAGPAQGGNRNWSTRCSLYITLPLWARLCLQKPAVNR